jgi:Ca2+-binding EF-hand superfamily protein
MRDRALDDVTTDRAARMVGDVDTDADGLISRAEAEAGDRRMQRVLRNFDEADADGDGLISAEELQQALAARRKRRATGDRSDGHERTSDD